MLAGVGRCDSWGGAGKDRDVRGWDDSLIRG